MNKAVVHVPAGEIEARARREGLSLREAMKKSLEAGIFPESFRRNAGLVSVKNQIRLFDMPIFIAGCGGLGGEIAELLVRLGAGRLHLCDFDSFSESNLNRQRFCDAESLGKPKAAAAARALEKISPWGIFEPCAVRLEGDALPPQFGKSAIVIDCLDSVAGKKMLEGMAAKAALPWLHGAVLQQEGFACLRPRAGNVVGSLYGENCSESGAGSVLAHVVAGAASLMISLFLKWLDDPAYSSPLVHADFSIPTVESFRLS